MPFFTVCQIIMSWSGKILCIFFESPCFLKSWVFCVKAYSVCWGFSCEVINEGFRFIVSRTYKTIRLIDSLIFESDVWRCKGNSFFSFIKHIHWIPWSLLCLLSNIVSYGIVEWKISSNWWNVILIWRRFDFSFCFWNEICRCHFNVRLIFLLF